MNALASLQSPSACLSLDFEACHGDHTSQNSILGSESFPDYITDGLPWATSLRYHPIFAEPSGGEGGRGAGCDRLCCPLDLLLSAGRLFVMGDRRLPLLSSEGVGEGHGGGGEEGHGEGRGSRGSRGGEAIARGNRLPEISDTVDWGIHKCVMSVPMT